MDSFEVHTNFTDTVKRVYDFNHAGLAAPSNIDVLRRVFTEPNSLRPDLTAKRVTEQLHVPARVQLARRRNRSARTS